MAIKKVYAVTVTYGDRFYLLKEVIDSLLKENIYKIIVVDNNSDNNSLVQLQDLENNLSNLEVIYLKENLGSAGGFKVGLELVHKKDDCDFIWLLDDDNKPLDNSLKVLTDFWYDLDIKNKNSFVSLLSYRESKPYYVRAAIENKDDILLGSKNSFNNFHIKDLVTSKFRKIFFKNLHKNTPEINLEAEMKNTKYGRLNVAPYGGMFFHKDILNTINYPNEQFYIYCDDYEYSHRIIKAGGSILIVFDSKIKDLIMIQSGNEFRKYYNTRNTIYFKKYYYASNKLIFLLNVYLFILILKLRNKENKILLRAIKDGLNDNLGVNNKIFL